MSRAVFCPVCHQLVELSKTHVALAHCDSRGVACPMSGQLMSTIDEKGSR